MSIPYKSTTLKVASIHHCRIVISYNFIMNPCIFCSTFLFLIFFLATKGNEWKRFLKVEKKNKKENLKRKLKLLGENKWKKTMCHNPKLGFTTKQGLTKVRSRVKPETHISCSWEYRRVWGNEPTHSQVTPTLEVGFLMDFRIFKDQLQ
jgi:hypothetical protein